MYLTADTRAVVTTRAPLRYPPTHSVHVDPGHRPIAKVRLCVKLVHVVVAVVIIHGKREVEHLEVGRVEEDVVRLLRG